MTGSVVFDSSSLIAFHQVGQLELLRRLFGQLVAPPIVVREVTPSLGALPYWVDVQRVLLMPTFGRPLDSGERAAIALALQISANLIVLDDLAGRIEAEALGLTVTGSLGILVRAKRQGLISAVRPLMIDMMDNGLFVSVALQQRILALAEESDL